MRRSSGWHFDVNPLYAEWVHSGGGGTSSLGPALSGTSFEIGRREGAALQGYLAHKKQPPPLRAAIGP